MEVYTYIGTFDGVDDFFFIYQCMYNGNFFNIRNESCHGRDYIEGSRLLFALKVSLICLDLILNRLDIVKNNRTH